MVLVLGRFSLKVGFLSLLLVCFVVSFGYSSFGEVLLSVVVLVTKDKEGLGGW